MNTLQHTLLGAVSASDSPAVFQYALKNLGKGVLGYSPYSVSIERTKQSLRRNLSDLFTRANPPQTVRSPRKTAVPSRVVRSSTALPQGLAQELAQQQRQLRAQQLEQVWRDQAERQQVLASLMRQMWEEEVNDLQSRLEDDQPLVRWAAAQVIGQRWLPREAELIGLLSDASAEVRQAARQALVRLSRGCDFGPAPQATAAQRSQAATEWRHWLSLQDRPTQTGELTFQKTKAEP